MDGPKGTLVTQGGPNEASRVIHKGPAWQATALAVDSSNRIYIAPPKNSKAAAAVLVKGRPLVPIPDLGIL